jgi:pimeloyl-ACP methyl ester carboxylesterase
MAYFSNGGIRFYYEVHGEGHPLVYSHGLGGNSERIGEFVDHLPGMRVILYDNRAHGRTAPLGDASALTFDRMAEDMAGLLDHLGVAEAVVGGVSMGAGVALAFALRFPDRVRALILNRPAWLDSPSPENLAFAPLMADLLERYDKAGAIAAFRESAYCRSMQILSPGTVESLLAVMQEADPGALVAAYRWIPVSTPMGAMKRLCGLHVPALVLGNPDDPIHPLFIADAWARSLPEARLRIIPSRIISPAEHLSQFRAAVEEFLSTHGHETDSI